MCSLSFPLNAVGRSVVCFVASPGQPYFNLLCSFAIALTAIFICTFLYFPSGGCDSQLGPLITDLTMSNLCSQYVS